MKAGVKTGLLMNFNVTKLKAGSNASSSDPFVLFVSFVVKQFCTSARGTSLFSRPFVTLTQAAKVSRHQARNLGFQPLRAPRPRR